MNFSVRSRNRSSGTRTCATCIHDGQCDGLPHCGGTCWQNAYGECERCGGRVSLEDVEYQTDDGKHIFCSAECLDEWFRENGEDGEEGAEDGTR